jgi:phosphate uptake regulator
MGNAESILVLILAGTLAVFLVLSIVAAVMAIRILKKVERIAERAEDIADRAETAAKMFKTVAGPVAIGRIFAAIYETVTGKDRKKGRKDG